MTDRPAADSPADLIPKDLLRSHPEWTFWVSDAKRLWATWKHQPTPEQVKNGWHRTLDADDAEGMRTELAAEIERRRRRESPP
ncbi:hypothetical protein Aph01nite_08300 [Acrocarpospora phusangensis]|uniref:Uncharacterized protein n=1 Tax=Acrocarpospora phusangensis TaxID=1070424 RepID=A0A919UNA5_9ACTN|nr:hypothetical protein [Acrocarpospora phusangensis]GIH22520.1 hypothetical protein Aph01nite_08300 [Acrocarpospora phusangensis]